MTKTMNIIAVTLQVPPSSGSPWINLIIILLLCHIFWLCFIRPKRKERKEKEKASLQSRDDAIYHQHSNTKMERSSVSTPFSFCPSCGSKLKEGARFCSNCGNVILQMGQNMTPPQHFQQAMQAAYTIPNVYIKGKALSKAQRVLNLASSEQLIDVFSFSNGIVYIQTQGNQSLQAPLNSLSASFQYWPNTKQRTATIEFQGQKINLAEAPTSVSKADYDKVFYVLSQAGTTYGAESISPENMALADQMVSFQRGYSMANAMKRW